MTSIGPEESSISSSRGSNPDSAAGDKEGAEGSILERSRF